MNLIEAYNRICDVAIVLPQRGDLIKRRWVREHKDMVAMLELTVLRPVNATMKAPTHFELIAPPRETPAITNTPHHSPEYRLGQTCVIIVCNAEAMLRQDGTYTL